ncbi:hypothetical protein B0H14DRAFT_2645962 [Mycena olivaceomarginata]|nr:hypothetical protein B0H14DRAFT_2645962 [Mycena olivaceomarginata]
MSQLVLTNLRAEDLIMDIRGGGRDHRYYCLPPFRGAQIAWRRLDAGFHSTWSRRATLWGSSTTGNSSQHRTVPLDEDLFFSQARGQSQYFRLPGQQLPRLQLRGGVHRRLAGTMPVGYTSPSRGSCARSEHLTAEAWESLCRTGRKRRSVESAMYATARTSSTEGRSARGGAMYASAPRPQKAARHEEDDFVNFAIRGAGVVSSSAARTEQRYREMRLRGEEPELLVTRSLEAAASFALEEPELI